MTIGTDFANDLAKLLFNGTAIANIADNAASSPLTNYQLALHTASPGSGDQTANESTDPAYARKAVARNSGGLVVTDNVINPTSTITFNEESGPDITYTHVSVGVAASGASMILVYGELSTPIHGGAGKIPQLKTTTSITIS